MIDDLDFYVYRYKGYGKSFIKACQVSPDVYIQLALQLAYYKYEIFLLNLLKIFLKFIIFLISKTIWASCFNL